MVHSSFRQLHAPPPLAHLRHAAPSLSALHSLHPQSMLRIIALLSIVARCAAFGTVSGAPGGACIDFPAHLIAEETAKMGEEYAQFTSCDVIAEAGGCDEPDWSATVQFACCATCALPQRLAYAGLRIRRSP